MNDTWTIQAALDWTQGYLERKGDENPRLSSQWLLSEATGLSRIELYAHFDKPLSMEERDVLRGYVTRRGSGEPLQYITGEVGFRHITVKVRPGVLIPRPETEVLVSEGLAALPPVPKRVAADAFVPDLPQGEKGEEELVGDGAAADETHVDGDAAGGISCDGAVARGAQDDGDDADAALGERESAPADASRLLVADLCTGSGCIACSIAYEHPHARVIATDIAPEAVALARENAEALGLSERIEVLEGSLGNAVSGSLLGTFDLVISNPPYIPTAVLADIPREVADFEPSLALDGGADGLDLFKPLVVWAARALKPGAAMVVELHETCLDAAARIACDAGFETTKIVEDLAGRPRVLVAHTPAEGGGSDE
ncbi:N5-glutamine methyltransferase family protein [Raoultibacter phocaeensis]|uniref:N5-glutamine methyltransferase family protein n=1 Tax=Raoultibacter phocaeensis TaxID=2479841 RepID=UPI001117F439|nr:HemK/PrmC family methyltransferase [Raoultibacter phocaeensis]